MALPLYNVRFILLISASFITIFSSIAIYFCLPILISHLIRTQIALSPTSGSLNGWRLNTVIDRFYLYNISNYEDLLSANLLHDGPSISQRSIASVPRMTEIGPFTFKQEREKFNVKFDPVNETVVYDQRKKWTYEPQLSVAKSMQDFNSSSIYHVSVPLAGTTLNPEFADLVQPTVSEFNLRLILNHPPQVLLLEGHPDILMEQAKQTGQIDVDRFGWLYNQNNSVTKDICVFTGPSNATLDKIGSIDQIQRKRQINIWHNNNTEPSDTSNVQCNEFRYSSAGEFFPPPEHSIISHNNYQERFSHFRNQDNHEDLNGLSTNGTKSLLIKLDHDPISVDPINAIHGSSKKASKSISIFMPDFCRSFRLYYNESLDYRGLSVDRYIANEFTFDYSEQKTSSDGDSIKNANKCYCTYNETSKLTTCPPNGMMDLFNCRKGSPLTVSFPHFHYSRQDESLSPFLRLFKDEVTSNENEHQLFLDLENSLNIPVRAQIAIQFNVRFRAEASLNFTREYAFLLEDPKTHTSLPDLYLPQMWFRSNAEIDEDNLNNLKFIQKQLGLVTPIASIVMFGFGSILLMMSAKLAYDLTYGSKSRKSRSNDQDSCSSLNQNDPSYPIDKQKYFAMQLSGEERYNSSGNGIDKKQGNHVQEYRLDTPTTSKNIGLGVESQPLKC